MLSILIFYYHLAWIISFFIVAVCIIACFFIRKKEGRLSNEALLKMSFIKNIKPYFAPVFIACTAISMVLVISTILFPVTMHSSDVEWVGFGLPLRFYFQPVSLVIQGYLGDFPRLFSPNFDFLDNYIEEKINWITFAFSVIIVASILFSVTAFIIHIKSKHK